MPNGASLRGGTNLAKRITDDGVTRQGLAKVTPQSEPTHRAPETADLACLLLVNVPL